MNSSRPSRTATAPSRSRCARMLPRARAQQYDTAEKQPGPQQSGYSRFGVQDSLVPLRRQRAQLVEKLLTYRARRDAGLLAAEHPVHVVERVSRAFGSSAGAYRVLPFGALDRARVFTEQYPHLGLLRDGHADGLPVHGDQSGRLVGDVDLRGGELFPRHHNGESEQSAIDQADTGHEWRQRSVVPSLTGFWRVRSASHKLPAATNTAATRDAARSSHRPAIP